jgi:polyisoprenyl-phosphate glycosyltransferase
MLLSVIIPCFNEEEVIEITYNRLKKILSSMTTITDYELIFVNDGSWDNTYKILLKNSLTDYKVKIINFSRNFGHQPAVTSGLNLCKGDIAVIIDADLQDPPEVIPEMVQLFIEKECNAVYGVRSERKGENSLKKTTARYFYRLLNKLTDVHIPVDTGDFRLIDRKIIDQFNKLPETQKYIRGLISWIGFKQEPIYYTREPRFAGKTKYPLVKMLKFASTAIFYFSKKPLKLATTLGFFTIIVGLMLAAWIISNKIIHPEYIVNGWTSMVLVVIFFGGVQLLTIGVLGQYIGNLFDEVKHRPEYIIADKINM